MKTEICSIDFDAKYALDNRHAVLKRAIQVLGTRYVEQFEPEAIDDGFVELDWSKAWPTIQKSVSEALIAKGVTASDIRPLAVTDKALSVGGRRVVISLFDDLSCEIDVVVKP